MTSNTVPPLDVETAVRLMREIVAEVGPEFVYVPKPDMSGCFYIPLPELRTMKPADWPADDMVFALKDTYVPDPTDPREVTGCLIGRLLDRHGFTMHRTWECRNVPLDTAVDRWSWHHLFVGPTVAVLRAAQQVQDGGGTWGEALAAAERTAAQTSHMM